MLTPIKTRYNYEWKKPAKKSCPIKEEYELITIIEPISFNEDKSIKEYRERQEYVVRKTKWKDFIKSFDIGSVSEQVINHLTKGTPLITAHVLPDGDYTDSNLLKGAEIKRKLADAGITLNELEAIIKAKNEPNKEESEKVEGAE